MWLHKKFYYYRWAKGGIILFYSLIHEFNILDIIVGLNRVKITSPSDMVPRNQVLQFLDTFLAKETKDMDVTVNQLMGLLI